MKPYELESANRMFVVEQVKFTQEDREIHKTEVCEVSFFDSKTGVVEILVGKNDYMSFYVPHLRKAIKGYRKEFEETFLMRLKEFFRRKK